MIATVNLPNAITAFRVLLAPVVAILLLQPSASTRLLGGAVFLVAAISDLVDGAIARRSGQITDFGQLVDPIADKLLLVATLVPFWWLTWRHPELGGIPWFGGIGLWILAVFFGREILVTVLRTRAARRGIVVPARTIGKRKAVAQSVFIGSMIVWLAFRTAAVEREWSGGLARFWTWLNGWFTTVSLVIALALTVISLVVYLVAFRRLGHGAAARADGDAA